MNKDEFNEYIKKNDDNITTVKDIFKNKEFKNFKVFCKKCGSGKIIISTNFAYMEGSEYTGIYGENVDLLIKCKDCGNAEELNLQ